MEKKNSNNKSETFPGYGKKKNREISTAIKSLFLVRHFKIERIQVIFLFWVIFICAAGTEDIWGCSSDLTVSAVTRLIFTWIWADLEESTELNQGIFFCCCWLVGFVSELCSDFDSVDWERLCSQILSVNYFHNISTVLAFTQSDNCECHLRTLVPCSPEMQAQYLLGNVDVGAGRYRGGRRRRCT